MAQYVKRRSADLDLTRLDITEILFKKGVHSQVIHLISNKSIPKALDGRAA